MFCLLLSSLVWSVVFGSIGSSVGIVGSLLFTLAAIIELRLPSELDAPNRNNVEEGSAACRRRGARAVGGS
ncbi:hypothetical protein THAOC_12341 [Thalassiosira oceanica]|uniref:Uncharacterized protein n=1 Tax=Thalassiosira oceanica TaxID=159749 RepID=K0T0D6_THAOC|nr:hypothetical protein THAOC_12341 [Thalassiosira oceanica]|eukprot:EJK66711.1 hypothetical protein THAOC_12341 [Thalassiosira oceanica]